MLKIQLLCAAGVSTSLLMAKMKEEAALKGDVIQVKACPITEINNVIAEADVALIAPQIAYMKAKSKKVADSYNVPLEVISMKDYGHCNGAAVLELAKSLVKDK